MSNDENKELRERVALLERLLLEQRSQQPGMPVDPEVARQRHAEILEKGDLNHRLHVARTNRANGHAAPKVGDVFYVWLAKQVRGGVRSREGLSFATGQNVKVEVVEGDDSTETKAAMAARRAGGESVVTVDGMERIFEDDTLVVNKDPRALAAEDLAAAQAQLDAALAETARLRAELETERAAASARRGAQDTGDGRPARLPAAAKARAEHTTPGIGKEPDKG